MNGPDDLINAARRVHERLAAGEIDESEAEHELLNIEQAAILYNYTREL